MSKLHELLAVESNLEGQATKAQSDLTETFSKKRHLFGSKIVTFKADDSTDSVTEEQSDIQTTVYKELDWISGILAKTFDISYQIDIANTEARADVVLEDDTVLLKSVPATALLALEKKVKSVHDLCVAIPTLDPAKGFKPDEQKGLGFYQARPTTTTRTRKERKVLVAYAATKEHPAQCQVYDADVPVGKIQTQEWSSLITPAEKAEILNRCDVLLRAVRKARSRANDSEVNVVSNKVGKALLNYIFKG